MSHPLSKRNRKRIEILRSAAAVFRRRGYHGTRVDEIARRLGMTTGNLYYYFKNKEEILFVCHDYSLDCLLELLKEVEQQDLSPPEKLHRLIVGFAHVVIDELQGTAITLNLEDLPADMLRKVIAKRDRFDRAVRQIIRDGMEEGVFSSGDPKLLAFAILGAVNWIPRWFNPNGAVTSQRIGDVFANFLVGGLLTSMSTADRDAALRAILTTNSQHQAQLRVPPIS